MVIIALDFPNKEETINFLKKFDEPLWVKVGMELFYGCGPSIITDIKKLGHHIFLDLKLHDIPNTVKSAMKNLAKLDIDMVNVHAKGGIKMMSEALTAFDGMDKKPLVIAVTELTSTSQEMLSNELLCSTTMEKMVIKHALNAKEAGLNGVVCSPLEVKAIKEACGSDFITVTPGIRLKSNSVDDQVRITTPADARVLGTNFIVVGRPITKAEDPVSAYKQIKKDFMGE
ncbi:MAG: orotidine-5'-phosphate decarboxylase [bacterium]|nr:orotidine-5'-phosphate decarboxylase [bacterium]